MESQTSSGTTATTLKSVVSAVMYSINQSQTSDSDSDSGRNCSHDEPYTDEYYAAINLPGLLFIILAIMTLLTIATFIIFLEIFRYMHKMVPFPKRRTRVTWVIGTFPVISFVSLIALFVPRAFFVCLIYSSLYLSVALYQFMLLILDYYGGRLAIIEVHKGNKFHLAMPPYLCCCKCLPWIELTENTLIWIKRGVLQVALIRPAELFLSSVLWSDGKFEMGELSTRGGIYTILNGITFVSTIIAVFFLNMLFRISKDVLADYSITPKFMIMQTTLILTNVQHLVLSFIVSIGVVGCRQPMSTYTRANMLYNLLIIVEMFIIMILARILYRRRAGNISHLLEVTNPSTKPLLTPNGAPSPDENGLHEPVSPQLVTSTVNETEVSRLRNGGASNGSLSESRTQSVDNINGSPLTSTLISDQFNQGDENISLSEGQFTRAKENQSSMSSIDSHGNPQRHSNTAVTPRASMNGIDESGETLQSHEEESHV
ncbi:organic solute transporter subunit alpha-like [Ptychodera flava]|uniref:organic solute transporter subunit alpha-like n=1 Tax=Ptychodera flava TaxID=63121 RepID=UPI00396AAA3B